MAKKIIRRPRKRIIISKKCFFCDEKKEPWFSDIENLQRFLTERGKIMGRSRTGICAKHQKQLTLAVKYARHLALLPFVARD